MKKLLLLAIPLLMVGCSTESEENRKALFSRDGWIFEVVEIDSCEYIYGGYRLSHKGNCHFCSERRKQEIAELIEELKEK